MKYRHWFFDLDGTLLDTVPDILDNINLMLKHFGYKTIDEETLKSYVGCGARNLCARSIGLPVTEAELDERLLYYNRMYTSSESPKTRLFDGVGDMLRILKKRGYKPANRAALDAGSEFHRKFGRWERLIRDLKVLIAVLLFIMLLIILRSVIR